ncbi:hypothetical protein LUD23_30535, partial [Klebsiella pneumoniae]|nr:hypothetical protein [Klebsiella pneumoniae]
IYTDEGEFDSYLMLPRNPNMVIVDTQIVAGAPARLLAAGIGDDQYQETRGIACSGLQRCIKNTRLSPGVLLWFIPIPAGSA